MPVKTQDGSYKWGKFFFLFNDRLTTVKALYNLFQILIICLVILAFGHFFGLTSGYQIQENDNEFLLQIPNLLEKETAKTTQMNNGILNQNDVTNILYNMLIKIKAYNERNQK